jgi:hypothetical protein
MMRKKGKIGAKPGKCFHRQRSGYGTLACCCWSPFWCRSSKGERERARKGEGKISEGYEAERKKQDQARVKRPGEVQKEQEKEKMESHPQAERAEKGQAEGGVRVVGAGRGATKAGRTKMEKDDEGSEGPGFRSTQQERLPPCCCSSPPLLTPAPRII